MAARLGNRERCTAGHRVGRVRRASHGQGTCRTCIEGPCDMFIFHEVQHAPAVLWEARGGNTHNADEYIEIDTLIEAAKVLPALTPKGVPPSSAAQP